MTLPPKALNALVRIRAELLSKPQEQSVIITLEPEPEPVKRVMRHARRPNAFQRMCQRREYVVVR